MATLGLTASLTQPNVNALPHGPGGVLLVSLLRVTTPYSLNFALWQPFLAASLGGASFVASSLLPTGKFKNWYV